MLFGTGVIFNDRPGGHDIGATLTRPGEPLLCAQFSRAFAAITPLYMRAHQEIVAQSIEGRAEMSTLPVFVFTGRSFLVMPGLRSCELCDSLRPDARILHFPRVLRCIFISWKCCVDARLKILRGKYLLLSLFTVIRKKNHCIMRNAERLFVKL